MSKDKGGGGRPPWERNTGKFDKPTSTADPRPVAPRRVRRVIKEKPAAKAPGKRAAKPAAAPVAQAAAKAPAVVLAAVPAKTKAPTRSPGKRSAPVKKPAVKEPRKPRVKPKPKPAAKPTADIIRPAQFQPKPAAKGKPADQAPVDLAEAEQSIGQTRQDIIGRLVSDGAPLDRARQFTDLVLEYAACSVMVDKFGPVSMGNESAWAIRRDKVRKAMGDYRLIDATWLWELMP